MTSSPLYQNGTYKVTVTELVDGTIDPSMRRVYLITHKADGVVLAPARSLPLAIATADEAAQMLQSIQGNGMQIPAGLNS